MTGTIPAMHMIRSALAGLIALLTATAAVAQQFPTIPSQSVIGRLGVAGSSGPSQAIPLATLQANLSGAQLANTVNAGPASGVATFATFRALVGADLPNPGAASKGGVQSLTCSSSNWFRTLSTAGVLGCSQPVIADISGFGTGVATALGIAVNTAGGFATVGGGGLVTSLTPAGGLVSSNTASCSQTAITGTGTLYKAECVNPQTGTSYAIVDGDRAKLITSSNAAAQAYSIAQAGAASAFQAGWYVDIQNISTNVNGVVTVTPATSTIWNGTSAAATLKIQPGQFVRIVSDGTNYQVHGLPSAAQFPGTATNDAANAGNVGEYIESIIASGSATSLTTATAKTITSISLTAGDWDVSGNVSFNAAGSANITYAESSISLTTNTVDTTVGRSSRVTNSGSVPNNSPAFALPAGPVRFSLSSTTSIFLVANSNFTVGTLTGWGIIRARRIR